MDRGARQLLILAAFLRDEFHKVRDTLHEDIVRFAHRLKNIEDTVSTQRQTEQKSHHAESVSIAELRTQVPIRIQNEAKQSAWKVIKNSLEVIGIVAVVCYTCLTYGMWIETQRANNFSSKALEAQTRPWIGLEGDPEEVTAHGTLGEDYKTYSIDFSLNLRNYGQSPARNVALQVRPFFDPHQKGWAPVNEVCDAADKDLETRLANHYFTTLPTSTIFPGNQHSYPQHLTNVYYIMGCAAYTSLATASKPYHPYHTWFIYRASFGERPGKILGCRLALEDSDAQ